MSQPLKADTASQELVFGPFLDKTDGVAPETAISAPTAARVWKNGVTSTINLSTGRTPAWTHDGDGFYTVGTLATDVDTEGRLKIEITDAATHLPVWENFTVRNANVYDSLFAAAATDYLQVDLLQMGGVAQSATDLKDFADAGYDPGTNKVQGVVLADTVTTLTGHTAQTGDGFARLGAPAGASVSADILAIDNFVDDLESRLTAARAGYLDNLSAGAVAQASVCTEARLAELDAANLPTDIDAILADTDDIGVAGAGLTAIPWNAAWDAQVQSEVQDALEANDLDHLIEITAGVEEPTDGSYLDQIMHKSAGQTFDPTTDSLEALRDTAPMGTTMRGTDNAALASVCLEARLAELDAANLPSDIDAILADTGTDGVVVAAGSKSGYALSAASRAAIWDEVEGITGDSISFETILARMYMFLFHEMNITDSTGVLQVRNSGDTGNVMTGQITDDDTTTDRIKATFL